MQDGKYVARIAVKGRMRYLGSFATALEAATRYASEIGEERAAVEAVVEGNVEAQPPLRHESTPVCTGSTECDGRRRSAAAHGKYVPMGNRALARD